MADDVRRRRAERVRQQRAKTLIPQYKWYILGAVAVISLIAVAAAFPGVIPKGPPAKKFVHEHPAFAVFADGERINFNHPDYDLRNIGEMSNHIHYGETNGGAVIHIEASFPGGIPDITLQQFFRTHGLIFEPGRFKLDTKGGHDGREWRDDGNKTWQVYVSKFEGATRGNFTQLPGDYTKYAPRDGDKILITYGNLTAEQLATQQAAVPDPPGSAPAQHPS